MVIQLVVEMDNLFASKTKSSLIVDQCEPLSDGWFGNSTRSLHGWIVCNLVVVGLTRISNIMFFVFLVFSSHHFVSCQLANSYYRQGIACILYKCILSDI